ncbi:sigma factor-like helix-turn-helix DNA-binding protein [Rhodococcus triatomae]
MTGVRSAESVIAELPRRLQDVLHLRIVQGLSVDRTARLLGTEREHVLLLQHQALDALRRRLRDAEAAGYGGARGVRTPRT